MNTILQKRIEEVATFLFKQRGLDKESCRQAMYYILANQWISVEEALPDYNEAVIGIDYMPELDWDDQTIIFVHRSNNPDVVTDKNKFCVYPPSFCKVTHWMEILSLKGGKK
jgi:hypothetical protein